VGRDDRVSDPRAPLVVVMGVAGAGKSTVGPLVAERLHVPFVDADDLHDPGDREQMRRGEPLIEVALGAQYGSPEAFARAFRNAFGRTPTAYRRAMPPPPQRPPLSLAILLDLNTFALSLQPLQGGTAMEVRIECFPDRLAVCEQHTGPYNEVSHTFRRMYAWARGAGILDDATLLMGLSYDDPKTTPSNALRYDVCLTVPEPVENLPQGIRLDMVPGGRYAVHTLRGSYGGMHVAFERMLGRWLPASGEEIDDRPCIEIYLNGASEVSEAALRTELCIPLL